MKKYRRHKHSPASPPTHRRKTTERGRRDKKIKKKKEVLQEAWRRDDAPPQITCGHGETNGGKEENRCLKIRVILEDGKVNPAHQVAQSPGEPGKKAKGGRGKEDEKKKKREKHAIALSEKNICDRGNKGAEEMQHP